MHPLKDKFIYCTQFWSDFESILFCQFLRSYSNTSKKSLFWEDGKDKPLDEVEAFAPLKEYSYTDEGSKKESKQCGFHSQSWGETSSMQNVSLEKTNDFSHQHNWKEGDTKRVKTQKSSDTLSLVFKKLTDTASMVFLTNEPSQWVHQYAWIIFF